jgi:hypothetical protein
MNPDDNATAIDNDAEDRRDDLGALDESGAEDAFLKTLTAPDQATDQAPEDGTETDAATDASDASEAEQQDTDPQADAPATETNDATRAIAADDAIVEVKVGDETHRIPVKDLKRLAGQEAALTRRSQEVAAERTALQKDAERTRTVLQKALARAEEKAKPYREMDFWKLNKELDAETFAQLRKDAQEAIQDAEFLQQELGAADEALTRAQVASRQVAAQDAVKALTTPDSPHHIKDWSPKLYGELLDFANTQGFDARMVVDPAAIKLLHMAMRFHRGQTVVREKVQKVAQQPRSPMRPGSAGSASPTRRQSDAAVTRLRSSGRAEDAEAAFLSRLRRRDDD